MGSASGEAPANNSLEAAPTTIPITATLPPTPITETRAKVSPALQDLKSTTVPSSTTQWKAIRTAAGLVARPAQPGEAEPTLTQPPTTRTLAVVEAEMVEPAASEGSHGSPSW